MLQCMLEEQLQKLGQLSNDVSNLAAVVGQQVLFATLIKLTRKSSGIHSGCVHSNVYLLRSLLAQTSGIRQVICVNITLDQVVNVNTILAQVVHVNTTLDQGVHVNTWT